MVVKSEHCWAELPALTIMVCYVTDTVRTSNLEITDSCLKVWLSGLSYECFASFFSGNN